MVRIISLLVYRTFAYPFVPTFFTLFGLHASEKSSFKLFLYKCTLIVVDCQQVIQFFLGKNAWLWCTPFMDGKPKKSKTVDSFLFKTILQKFSLDLVLRSNHTF